MKYALLAIYLLSTCAFAEVDYCHDEKTRLTWKKEIREFPDDNLVLHLGALHYGLCLMIDRGQISRNKAIDIFQSAKNGAISQRFTEQVVNDTKSNGEI